MVKLSKTTAQRLLRWHANLEQIRYEIMHILGEENCWGNFLSCWRKISAEADGKREGSLSVRVVTVYARTDIGFALLSKNVVKVSHLLVGPGAGF